MCGMIFSYPDTNVHDCTRMLMIFVSMSVRSVKSERLLLA